MAAPAVITGTTTSKVPSRLLPCHSYDSRKTPAITRTTALMTHPTSDDDVLSGSYRRSLSVRIHCGVLHSALGM